MRRSKVNTLHLCLWISVSISPPITLFSVSISPPITLFSVSISPPMIATALVHQGLAGSLKTRKIFIKTRKILLKRRKSVDNFEKIQPVRAKSSGCAATKGCALVRLKAPPLPKNASPFPAGGRGETESLAVSGFCLRPFSCSGADRSVKKAKAA